LADFDGIRLLLTLGYYEQFHLCMDALARLPFSDFSAIGFILAQNDFFLPASALVFGFGAGAFRLEPVALFILARPLAVSPAPFDTGNFSPRPTDNTGVLVAIV
jgi:hypothetical protein